MFKAQTQTTQELESYCYTLHTCRPPVCPFLSPPSIPQSLTAPKFQANNAIAFVKIVLSHWHVYLNNILYKFACFFFCIIAWYLFVKFLKFNLYCFFHYHLVLLYPLHSAITTLLSMSMSPSSLCSMPPPPNSCPLSCHPPLRL